MFAGIQVEIGKVSGPWFDVIEEGAEEENVMCVVPPHFRPRFFVTTHAREPQMFTSMWHLPPQAEKAAGSIKLVTVQLEMFPKDLERVDLLEGRSRWQFIIYKPGIGFFEIELITVVGDGDVARAKQLVKFFHEQTVVFEVLLVPFIVGEGSNGHTLLMRPPVGKREHIPIL